MTEDEAKGRWCPFTRAAGAANVDGQEWHSNRPTFAESYHGGFDLCLGSNCMAWRWSSAKTFDDGSTPVGDLVLSARTTAVLQALSIGTVAEIRRAPDEVFLRTPNCGRYSLNELRDQTGPYTIQTADGARNGFCGLAGSPQ